jgi:hypothetical protein
VDREAQPAVRPGLVLRVAAVAAYLCLTVVLRGADSLGGIALVYAAGFALGALTAGWWSLAVGAAAGLLILGDPNDFGLAFASFPASVASGVLGAKMRRSEAGQRMAPRMAQAGAVFLFIGVIGFLVFAVGYNDDAPNPAIVGIGFVVALVGVPVGLGLFCAGLVGSVGRGVRT